MMCSCGCGVGKLRREFHLMSRLAFTKNYVKNLIINSLSLSLSFLFLYTKHLISIANGSGGTRGQQLKLLKRGVNCNLALSWASMTTPTPSKHTVASYSFSQTLGYNMFTCKIIQDRWVRKTISLMSGFIGLRKVRIDTQISHLLLREYTHTHTHTQTYSLIQKTHPLWWVGDPVFHGARTQYPIQNSYTSLHMGCKK